MLSGLHPCPQGEPLCVGGWEGAAGWPGRLWLAAPEVHGTLRRTGRLMVSTHFAADPMLLPCLVLGLSAKVPAPRILPMLVLELATPFLQHGPVLGSSCSVHDPHALLQGGCRGFTVKPPCPKIAVTPQTSMLGGLCHPRDVPKPGMHQRRDRRWLLLLLGGSERPRE